MCARTHARLPTQTHTAVSKCIVHLANGSILESRSVSCVYAAFHGYHPEFPLGKQKIKSAKPSTSYTCFFHTLCREPIQNLANNIGYHLPCSFFIPLFFFPVFFFLIFIYSFIYSFIYGCVGSSFLCEGFLQLWQVGATLHRGARASHYRGLSCCGAQAPDAQAQ